MQLAQRIGRMSRGHWLVLFALVLGAWTALYALAVLGLPAGHPHLSLTPGAAGYGTVFLMWAVMSAAMMAPTFLPALATYDALDVTDRRGFYGLLAGYLLIWIGFSALAAAAQMGLSQYGFVPMAGMGPAEQWAAAALLILAGLYQFSALKAACLSKCRMPLTFFMQHWTGAPGNALVMGVRLGVICLGCCWALMLLGLIGGAMTLLWMGLATLIMTLEKLPAIGRYVTPPLGFALIGAGAILAATAF